MEKKEQEESRLVEHAGRCTQRTGGEDAAVDDWIGLLSTYQTCMDHEQSIRTSYQSLLTTLEVALFALLITLHQLELRSYFWLLAITGISLCFCFGIACEYRARNVDIWRVRIVRLVSGTVLEDAFREGRYRWIPLGRVGYRAESLVGHWFERILIPSMLLIWLFILWYFPIQPSFSVSLLIRLFSTFVACGWISYVFGLADRLIEKSAFSCDYRDDEDDR